MISAQARDTWTQPQMRDEARGYRHDHDDGGPCFFDPERADWHLTTIDPHTLGVFESADEAREWLDHEIAMHEADGIPQHHWTRFLDEGFDEPVIVGEAEGRRQLWDGYHRTAIAILRHESLPAILGAPSS